MTDSTAHRRSAGLPVFFNSLRARLTLWHLAIAGISLSIFAGLLYLTLARTLERHHDGELEADGARLAQALAGRRLDALGAPLLEPRGGSSMVMVRDTGGELHYRSPALELGEPNIGRNAALVHAASRGATAPEFFTAGLERLGATRFICVPVATLPGSYLQIGVPLGDVAHLLRAVRTGSFILIPVVLILTSFGGWIVASRALAPTAAIDRTLQTIQASDLSRRVEVQPADVELGRLVASINRLLDRLERAFSSLRQFAGDVSHQLQTPLAIMKATIESASDTSHRAEALDELSAEVEEMSETLNDLQALALADADLARVPTRAVDFSRICDDAAEIIGALGEPVSVTITRSVAPGLEVHGDAGRLKQVVLNLGDNAVKYTAPGGTVHIELARAGGQAVLEIRDTGRGIAAEDLPRIFDRFFRARDKTGNRPPGTGLGLAIAKRIIDVHGGSISVKSEPDRGTVFQVVLRTSEPRG